MLGENKNLKDSITPSPLQGEGRGEVNYKGGGLSYTKTNKLITALYMVTDIIDKDEPLRNKLRTLGIEILSDINSLSRTTLAEMGERIGMILSLLDIASTINIISEMNSSILKKEFLELEQSIKESIGDAKTPNRQINLLEFFKEELPLPLSQSHSKGHYQSIGHYRSINIGVQKGSTLLKAIKDMSNKNLSGVGHPTVAHNNFDILKKQRREEITNLIKKHGESSTITDIKNVAYGSLVSCSEKTLQRELISMVKDGVLKKTGEKRWSRYFLASSTS